MRISIKLKLSVVLAVLLALTVLLLSEMILRGIERNQRQRMEEELAQISQVAGQYVRQNYLTGDTRLEPEAFMDSRGQRLAMYVSMLSGRRTVMYDRTGREVGDSLSVPPEAEPDVRDALGYARAGRIAYQTSGESLVYFSPIFGQDGLIGIVSFYDSLRSDRQFLDAIRGLFRTVGVAVFVGGFVLGYAYFYRFASVISKLRAASQQIRSARFLRRPPTRRRDELGELGRDIFYMSNAIEAHLARQKQFIGNFSHEFKTPLTSIKAYVDLLDMYRDDPQLAADAAASIGKETDRLLEMVEKVLRLAALEKYEFEQSAERVELSGLLADLCDRLQGKAAKFDLTLTAELSPVAVWADRERMEHILINLIDNAIKYNVPGGAIRVRCAREGGEAVVRVADTGIGIPPDAREKVFEPFYTVNKDRARSSGGTGLGLSLVKAWVEKQSGSIALKDLDPGERGTTFELRFPLAAKAQGVQKIYKSETTGDDPDTEAAYDKTGKKRRAKGADGR